MTLMKYWVRDGYWLDDEHLLKLEPANHLHRKRFYLAADVDRVVEEMRERIKVLVQHYDKHVGTPCEQIRHRQEVELLKADLARVTTELEKTRWCRTAACTGKATIHLCNKCLYEEEETQVHPNQEHKS